MTVPSLFYIRLNGRVQGPFSPVKIAAMRDQGRITVQSELSPDKVSWVSAQTLDWLYIRPETVAADTLPHIILNESTEPSVSPTETSKRPPPLSPPSGSQPLPVPLEKEELISPDWLSGSLWGIVRLLWSPGGIRFYSMRTGAPGRLAAGAVLTLGSLMVLLIFGKLNTAFCANQGIRMLLAVLGVWGMVYCFCALGRFAFSNEKGGGASGDLLLSGLPLFYSAVAVLVAGMVYYAAIGLGVKLHPSYTARLAVAVWMYVGVMSLSALGEGLVSVSRVRQRYAGLILLLIALFSFDMLHLILGKFPFE